MQKIYSQFYLLFAFLFLSTPWAFADTGVAKSSVVQVSAGGMSAYTLANGFKIILIPFPTASNVRVELLVKTGSKLEGYGETAWRIC